MTFHFPCSVQCFLGALLLIRIKYTMICLRPRRRRLWVLLRSIRHLNPLLLPFPVLLRTSFLLPALELSPYTIKCGDLCLIE